jgi:hypothetical protein
MVRRPNLGIYATQRGQKRSVCVDPVFRSYAGMSQELPYGGLLTVDPR